MATSNRTMQEQLTTLGADEVLAAAGRFFSGHQGVYSAFPDKKGPGWVSFRGQGGEELVIAAGPHAGATRVTGSSYLFDMQVSRFFASLPPAPVDGAGVPATNDPAHGEATR